MRSKIRCRRIPGNGSPESDVLYLGMTPQILSSCIWEWVTPKCRRLCGNRTTKTAVDYLGWNSLAALECEVNMIDAMCYRCAKVLISAAVKMTIISIS